MNLIETQITLAPSRGGAHLQRRRWLGAAGSLSLLAALGGCQAPPTAPASAPPAAPRETREATLQRLGFKRTDDGWEFSFPGKLLFDTGSDALDADSQQIAERIGKGLVELGIDKLRVEGHTDNVGSAQYNQALSLKRAEAVAKALASAGLPLDRIEVRGLGKDKPIVDNATPEGRSQNRRVAVVVQAL